MQREIIKLTHTKENGRHDSHRAQMPERSKGSHSRCDVETLEGSNPSLCIFCLNIQNSQTTHIIFLFFPHIDCLLSLPRVGNRGLNHEYILINKRLISNN